MTSYELILAHQASLNYLFSNLPDMGTAELAELEAYWHPGTPQGKTHLVMIAKATGRKINEELATEIRMFYVS